MARRTESEIVYGIHPIEEACAGARRWLALHVKDAGGERAALVAEAKARGVRVRTVPLPELTRMAKGGNHQGAVAEFEAFQYTDADEFLQSLAGQDDAVVVVLDSVKDPGNFGAILRTAAAAGARGVIVPSDRAVGVTPAVVRASAGAADRIPVVRVVNVARALEDLKQQGFWVFGADAGGDAPLWDVDLRGRAVIVLGEEGRGMRPLVRKHCDRICEIPMPGKFESLNVAAAAAVLLFEAVRQRRG